MSISKILAALLIMGTATANAADIGGITVNGEVAFDYNFLSSKDAAIPNTEGATNEAYRLNKAQVLLKKETEQISFLGRLVHTPTQYSPDGAATSKAYFGVLDQMELFYKVNPQLQIGFGRFLTTMGYESLMRYENAFYNDTIAYQTIVPGYGEGLRAKYTPGDWLTATLSTYNQFTYGAIGEDYAPTKTTELSVTGVLAGKLTWFAGYLIGTDAAVAPATGKKDNSASSVWASYKFMDNLMLAVTYDSRTFKFENTHTHWADSVSAVLTYGIGINNLGLRYEMVRGGNEIGYGGAADKVNALSVTDKIVLNDNLNLYAEFRMDHSDADSFLDKDGAPTADAQMVTLGALAHF
ncbi:outer membrane beta-barrel protein [Bdellovibrio sp. BCCA]|uniref:outer membrane beta-barrel protein n=1 Tax=Bdellovibrio sp. BCCA TaxID=3136281 RepID=UPI0030F1D9B7